MKFRILIIFSIAFATLFGQSVQDVYRFSSSPYLGSTRFVSAGGAFTSLGNDFTAAHQNPAGLAVFRRSEIGISMGGYNNDALLNYEGSSMIEDKKGFQFSNLGLVLKFQQKGDRQWSFGVSYNRMADYNQIVSAVAQNVPQSRIDM